MNNNDLFGPISNLDPDLDIKQVLDDVAGILEFIATDELMKLKENNFKEYQDKIEDKFPKFSERYYGIFMKLIKGEDISTLMVMLSIMAKIKEGLITYKEGEIEMGEILANKYVRKNE